MDNERAEWRRFRDSVLQQLHEHATNSLALRIIEMPAFGDWTSIEIYSAEAEPLVRQVVVSIWHLTKDRRFSGTRLRAWRLRGLLSRLLSDISVTIRILSLRCSVSWQF
jgi:hypothetical protein